jgi:hypothetical protein
MNNKTPPYNTGKVLIGSNYVPPRQPVSQTPDDMTLQSALLNKNSTLKTMFATLKEKANA